MSSSIHLNLSLKKGLTLLRHIAAHNDQFTMTELANSLGMDKGTTRRFLATLQDLGYIYCSPDRKTFSVTIRVLEFGYTALCGMDWRDVAKSHLEKLFDDFGDSCISVSLCILDDLDVCYLFRREKPGFLQLGLRVGARRPAFASSMGKVIMAMWPNEQRMSVLEEVQIRTLTPHTVSSRKELLLQLDTILEQGYAISDREISPLARSLAVPLMYKDQPLAAAAVSGLAERLSVAELVELALPRLRACVGEIAEALERMEYNR